MSRIQIVGCGAVGVPLAASLARAGREVVAIRARDVEAPSAVLDVKVSISGDSFDLPLEFCGLSGLRNTGAPIVIATKAYSNASLAKHLKHAGITSPLVLLQNGLNVERPFLECGFPEVYRGVLYVVSEGDLGAGFRFHPVAASPIGIVEGTWGEFHRCLAVLGSPGFPFRAEENIQREVWTKVTVNCVFNAVCPLVDFDNSLFEREEGARQLARGIISESVGLAERLGIPMSFDDLYARVLQISSRSTQAISTLQDLRAGRETEIEFLNLELARLGRSLEPQHALPLVEGLGRLIELKSKLSRRAVANTWSVISGGSS